MTIENKVNMKWTTNAKIARAHDIERNSNDFKVIYELQSLFETGKEEEEEKEVDEDEVYYNRLG